VTSRLVVLAAAALALTACDRLPRRDSAVTVRLPAPRTPAPGFAFAEARRSTAQPQAPATLR
jgi:hypothetical protein